MNQTLRRGLCSGLVGGRHSLQRGGVAVVPISNPLSLRQPCTLVRQRHSRNIRSPLLTSAATSSFGAFDIAGEDEHTHLRSLVSSAMTLRQQQKPTVSAVSELLFKLQLCFKIFFPDRPTKESLTPKEEVKRRLKMVLVADRCGMSPSSMHDLKKTIARALQDFVDIESEEAIEVNISSDPSLGTVYCVAIPVRRVRPEVRFAEDISGPVVHESEGVTLEWDPADFNSDPSSRFPMGC